MIMETQLEFPFVQPFIEAQKIKEQKDRDFWTDFAKMTAKIFPNAKDYDFLSLFGDIEPMENFGDDYPSIPLTIVVGERRQLEFPFSRAMEEAAWGSIGTVRFDYELDP